MRFSKHLIALILLFISILSSLYLFKETEYIYIIVSFILFSYLIILYIGVTRYRFNYFTKAIHSGKLSGISLTFDDGPNPIFTSKILDLLKTHNVKATFFVIGSNIKGNEALLKRINDEGHIIGNHSFKHNYLFNSLKSKNIKKDIEKCSDLIETITCKKVNFFRAPFGLTSPNIAKALKETHYKSIGWDYRTYDTMAKSKTKLLKKMIKNVNSSSIVLLHDNNAITYEALDSFLIYCKENGINIVSLDKMIGLNPYKN